MKNSHIEDLRKKLNEHHWEVSEELEGKDDLKVLPMEKSYACFVSEKPSVSLYFSKNNPKIWKKNLEEFVLNLNSVIFDKI